MKLEPTSYFRLVPKSKDDNQVFAIGAYVKGESSPYLFVLQQWFKNSADFNYQNTEGGTTKVHVGESRGEWRDIQFDTSGNNEPPKGLYEQ